jgi:hypothetical protein
MLETQSPPNIIIIMAGDQGWGDLSLHGNANLSTPIIDSLAVNGVQFDRFYVDPVCSPTRAAMLTGRQCLPGGMQYEAVFTRFLPVASGSTLMKRPCQSISKLPAMPPVLSANGTTACSRPITQHRLALSAKDIPGTQGFDFRLLQLDRVKTYNSP